MEHHMIIRKATLLELADILPLMEQLGYVQDLAQLKKRFEVFSNQEGYGVVVSEEDGKILGLVAWSKTELFIADKARLHIEGLVVDQNARRRGIGEKLMKYVEDYAVTLSPCIIDLTSGLRRAKDGSHEFYEALGYKNEGYMAKLYLRKEV